MTASTPGHGTPQARGRNSGPKGLRRYAASGVPLASDADATMASVTDEPLEPIHHVCHGLDRKPCQGQLDDRTWVDAEIRSQDRHEHGTWFAYDMWSTDPGRVRARWLLVLARSVYVNLGPVVLDLGGPLGGSKWEVRRVWRGKSTPV